MADDVIPYSAAQNRETISLPGAATWCSKKHSFPPRLRRSTVAWFGFAALQSRWDLSAR